VLDFKEKVKEPGGSSIHSPDTEQNFLKNTFETRQTSLYPVKVGIHFEEIERGNRGI